MTDIKQARSPFDTLVKSGLRKLEGYGIPDKYTGAVEKGVKTAQEAVAGCVGDFQNFSAAGFLRDRVTIEFLLDQLNGRTFQGSRKVEGAKAAEALECTLQRAGNHVEIYGVDTGGNTRLFGRIEIEGFQRFKARATALRIFLDPEAITEKTLSGINRLFKDDRHFGQVKQLTLNIDPGSKHAIAAHIRKNYLMVHPEELMELPWRGVMEDGKMVRQYDLKIPAKFDITGSQIMEEAVQAAPGIKNVAAILRRFAEHNGYKGPNVAGTAMTNGWTGVSKILGFPTFRDDWGYDPHYHYPEVEIKGLSVNK